MTGEDATAQHVHRVLRALELLADGPVTQAELARDLVVHRRTARRLLARLAHEGYAIPTRRGNRTIFVSTSRLVTLGHRVAQGLDMLDVARVQLASRLDASATARFVAALDADGVSFPHVEGPAPAVAGLDVPAGGRPLHATAAGKVFLSADTGLLDGILGHELLAFTDRTLRGRADLLLDLALVRKRGYATEDGEYRDGARSVASGVRDYTGQVVLAVGAVPARYAGLAELGELVSDAARECSREIGG